MGRVGIGIIFILMISLIVIQLTIPIGRAESEVFGQPPIPVISSPMEFTKYLAGYDILFDGSNSTDGDGDPLKYLWYSDRDGYIGTDPIFSEELSADNHLITLHVSDGTHNISTMISITVVPYPCSRDTDRDGIPNIIDTDDDDDGLPDVVEDRNQNGLLDPGETDPLNKDTDGDGVDDRSDPTPLNPGVPPPLSREKIGPNPYWIIMIIPFSLAIGLILFRVITTYGSKRS